MITSTVSVLVHGRVGTLNSWSTYIHLETMLSICKIRYIHAILIPLLEFFSLWNKSSKREPAYRATIFTSILTKTLGVARSLLR
jgi:hypothetical protein